VHLSGISSTLSSQPATPHARPQLPGDRGVYLYTAPHQFSAIRFLPSFWLSHHQLHSSDSNWNESQAFEALRHHISEQLHLEHDLTIEDESRVIPNWIDHKLFFFSLPINHRPHCSKPSDSKVRVRVETASSHSAARTRVISPSPYIQSISLQIFVRYHKFIDLANLI
jgi:hypothetical protein